jgi:hypothetical protein
VVNDDSDAFDWSVRNHIYAAILAQGIPPAFETSAADHSVSPDRVRAAYQRLHDRHALFLTPGTHDIRMAHPFSGVPTPFRVFANGRAYWANCAWDALGIPAALHADARIEAETVNDGKPIHLAVFDGRATGWDGVVHFALPFRRWYDDLILT